MATNTSQRYQDRSRLRIKFASIDEYGILTRDASPEYAFLQRPLLAGWSATPGDPVKIVRRDRHRTWVLRRRSETVVAVEHETGLEILLPIAQELASAAIIGLVVWSWKTWQASRKPQVRAGTKVESTLVLEEVSERRPDGTIRSSRKVQVRGPLTSAGVARVLRDWKRAA